MSRTFFLTIATLFISVLTNAAQLDGLEAKIDQFVQKYQSTPDTGIAVGVIQGNDLIFFKGYGYRDRENKLPVTPTTSFRIGSNTKSFVSTTLNILSDEGRVQLDSPVQRYLPDFQLESPEISAKANLVDLLSHRVGLPRHDLLWYMTPFDRELLFSKFKYLEMNKHEGYGFRQRWQYNNFMYITLGMLLEKVTGLSWNSAVTEKVLSPLQMTNTVFSVYDMQKFADYAKPYDKDRLLELKQYEPCSSAGVMISDVNDLKKWVSLFLNKGRTSTGAALVSELAQKRMFTVESQSDESHGIKIEYGLGWFFSKVAERRVIWHGGNIDGYSTHVSFIPEENLGLVVLVNQSNGNNFELPVEIPTENGTVKLLPTVIYEHLLNYTAQPPMTVSSAEVDLSVFTGVQESKINWWKSARRDFSTASMNHLDSGMIGVFSEIAYGDLSLSLDDEGKLHLTYYNQKALLEQVGTSSVYNIKDELTNEEIGMLATLIKDGDNIVEVQIPMEPTVSPIRFKAVRPTAP